MTFVIPPTVQTTVEVTGTDARFPVHRVYCVGRNYAKHAREMGMDPERVMHHNVISLIIKDAAKSAGMDPAKVSVHALRHMVASDLDKAGARLQDIQRFLGHAQPNTTAIYLQALRGPIPAMENELSKIRGAAMTIASPIIESDDA